LLPLNHLPACSEWNAKCQLKTTDCACMVKYVANTYLNPRFSSYAKIYSKAVVNFGKPSSRHHLTKTTLFLNL
jgi:hypothetical protein